MMQLGIWKVQVKKDFKMDFLLLKTSSSRGKFAFKNANFHYKIHFGD